MATANKYGGEAIRIITAMIRRSGNVQAACKAGGITEKTYYDWIKHHPEFSAAIEEAWEYFRKVTAASDEALILDAYNAIRRRLRGEEKKRTTTVHKEMVNDEENPGQKKVIKETVRVVDEQVIPELSLIEQFVPVVFDALRREDESPRVKALRSLVDKVPAIQDNTQRHLTLGVLMSLQSEIDNQQIPVLNVTPTQEEGHEDP